MFAQVDGGFFEIHDEPRVDLGECKYDEQTNSEWVHLKAGVAILQGDALMSSGGLSATTNSLQAEAVGTKRLRASSPNNFLTKNSDALGDLNIDNKDLYNEKLIVYVYAGGGEGQIGYVKTITATELTVEWLTSTDGKLKTALTTATDINFAAPWRAVKCTAGEGCVGIAQFDVAKDKYFWALRKGFGVGRVTTAASGLTVVAVNGELGLSATAGTFEHNGTTQPVAFTIGALAAGRFATIVPIQAAVSMPISVLNNKGRWT
jgi:hypothetical protein